MKKKVEKFYLTTIAVVFVLLIVLTFLFDAIGWEIALPIMILLIIKFIRSINEWMELFCSDAE